MAAAKSPAVEIEVFGRTVRVSNPEKPYFPEVGLKKLDVVWTPETVSKLFEIGPAQYTPGTKMPEQVIGSPDDRTALVRFLEKATR